MMHNVDAAKDVLDEALSGRRALKYDPDYRRALREQVVHAVEVSEAVCALQEEECVCTESPVVEVQL